MSGVRSHGLGREIGNVGKNGKAGNRRTVKRTINRDQGTGKTVKVLMMSTTRDQQEHVRVGGHRGNLTIRIDIPHQSGIDMLGMIGINEGKTLKNVNSTEKKREKIGVRRVIIRRKGVRKVIIRREGVRRGIIRRKRVRSR